MLLGAKQLIREKLSNADAAGGVAATAIPQKQDFRPERDGQRHRNVPQETRQLRDEVAFLEQGLKEVQHTSQIVYTENMDLRARIELLRLLASRLAQISGLPGDVQAQLQTVLEGVLPPRGVLNPDNHYDLNTESSTCAQSPGGHRCCSQEAFAAQLKELCKAMDQYQVQAQGHKKAQSEGNESSDARTTDTSQGHTGNCTSMTPALTEDGEGLWQRTRVVCYELFEGW
jgi:hypothetical protein